MLFNFAISDACYLLGAIHGDGCINIRKNGTGRVFVRGGRDDFAYASTIEEAFRNLGFSPRYEIDKSGHWKVVVNSSELARELRPYKNRGLWQLPKKLGDAHAWLAGIFDADGYIFTRWLDITQKHYENLKLAQSVLTACGFLYPIICRFRQRCSRLKLIWLADLELFAEEMPLRHPRKRMEIGTKLRRLISRSLGRDETLFYVLRALKDQPKSTALAILKDLKKRAPRDPGKYIWAKLWALQRAGLIKQLKRPSDQLCTDDRAISLWQLTRKGRTRLTIFAKLVPSTRPARSRELF
jgi:hypothetical protein